MGQAVLAAVEHGLQQGLQGASPQLYGPEALACRLRCVGPTAAAGDRKPWLGSGRWGASAPHQHLCDVLQQGLLGALVA